MNCLGLNMSTALQISGLSVSSVPRNCWAVAIILENVGTEHVRSGQVLALQRSKDGSVQTVEFFSTVDLAPGDKTKLGQLLRGDIREIDFKSYRTIDGESIPLSGVAKRRLFRWSLASAA